MEKEGHYCLRLQQKQQQKIRPDIKITSPFPSTLKPFSFSVATPAVKDSVRVTSVGTQTQTSFHSNFPVAVFSCSQFEGLGKKEASTLCCLPARPSTTSTSTSEDINFIPKTADKANNSDFSPSKNILSDLDNDEDFKIVTGCSRGIFNTLLGRIRGSINRWKKLDEAERLLLCLCKLKHNMPLRFLGRIFSISPNTVSSIYSSVLNALFHISNFNWWIPRSVIKATMPESFKVSYPNCTVILDATEIPCETPGEVKSQINMYSTYKSHHTIKFLIGIAPSGYITFLSQVYGGRATDCYITANSGILDLLQPGDEVKYLHECKKTTYFYIFI